MADVAPQEPSVGEAVSVGEAAVSRVQRNYLHEGKILKCTGSMVIEMLKEALKAAEEWKTSFGDLMRTKEELLCDLMRTKEENKGEVEILRGKVALLLDVNGKLFDKIAAQNKREALFLSDREKFLHEIHVRKKTKTLLIQERKEFLKKISGLKESHRLAERYKVKTLNTANSRRRTKAVLLLVRKELVNTVDAQDKTVTVLLQERGEMIDFFSKKIHAQKKRESQLLQERKKGEVKLRKALDKLQHHRNTVSDRTIAILWDVTKKVLALTMDVEDSQPIRDKTRTPRSKSQLKMPGTLAASWKQAERIISRAEDAFCEAAKNWVRDRDCIEAMKISCRKDLIEKILGRKERPSEAEAALRDILDESQTMERQPQTEHNILAAVELKDSEKKKARRKQDNPQRLQNSPSPSPQEMEVYRKRKRIGTSPPPSSEEMEIYRKRKRIGTSPPPPSKRMKRPRERKRPQRYRTGP